MEKFNLPLITVKPQRKDFPGLKVKVLSVGKHKNDSSLNEDGYVITENTFAVIDGSAARVGLKFNGKSTAQFATDVVRNVLLSTASSINGKELVVVITKELNKEIDKIGMRDIIQTTREACPAALFTAARIVGNKVIVTALGDVSCRLNGKVIHADRFKGEDLKEQVKKYFNNPNSELGLGIINGEVVPDKFIKTYTFDLKDIQTIELFSDGYFILPSLPKIESWEKAFFTGEKDDPLRLSKYPAVKAASKNMFFDDRTILIVRISVSEK